MSLPVSTDPVVAQAADYTRAHLHDITVGEVSRAVNVSERTLRRRFDTHLGMSWRSYLLRARVLRAMAMLAEPDRSVIDVSIAVGFDDVGAFARSFARHCGETPYAYKRRTREAPDEEHASLAAYRDARRDEESARGRRVCLP